MTPPLAAGLAGGKAFDIGTMRHCRVPARRNDEASAASTGFEMLMRIVEDGFPVIDVEGPRRDRYAIRQGRAPRHPIFLRAVSHLHMPPHSSASVSRNRRAGTHDHGNRQGISAHQGARGIPDASHIPAALQCPHDHPRSGRWRGPLPTPTSSFRRK
jgi:hypothetical protein